MKKLHDRESIEPTIWSVFIKWFDTTYIDEENPGGQENHVSFSYFPSKATKEEIEKAYRDYFPEYLKKKEKPEAEIAEIGVKNKGNHRWWLTWFAHETNQKFETEADMFADFSDWFYESGMNKWDNWGKRDEYPNNELPWCPMGADDRWRWQVCDCEECKKNGATRIVH